MDNHGGGAGQGNPYDRPSYYGDQNMLRQQMNAYAMQQMPYGMNFHQDAFSRRASYNQPEHRPSSLTSPVSTMPQNIQSWMHGYNSQQNQTAMSPEFPMNMPNMFQSRWEEQASLLQHGQFQSNNRDHTFRMQQEEQAQRDREILLHRERQLLQLQQHREHDLQLQRDKEEHAKRERELQIQKENEERLKRERELQLQHEREVQIQREREIQLQREREVLMQREREAQLQREREAQIEREKKAMYNRESMLQSHQFSSQHMQSSYFHQQSSLSNMNYFTHEQQMNYFNQRYSNNDMSPVRSAMQPNSFQHTLGEQAKSVESTVDDKSSSVYSSQNLPSSQVAISSSPSGSGQWVSSIVSTITASNTTRKISGSFESNVINSIVSEKGFFSSKEIDTDFLKNWNDITEMDLSVVDKHLFEQKDKEFGETNKVLEPTIFSTKPTDSNNSSHLKDPKQALGSTENDTSPSATAHSIQDTKFEATQSLHHHLDSKSSTTNEVPQSTQPNTSTTITFSQSNSLQVTQNSSVNINININMPSIPSLPLEVCDSVSKPQNSTTVVSSPKYSISEIQAMISANPEFHGDNVFSVISSNTKSLEKLIPSDGKPQSTNKAETVVLEEGNAIITQTQKSKQSFSSIESFLGMSANSNQNQKDKNSTKLKDNSEKPPMTVDQQERRSVIMPLASVTSEKMQDTEGKEAQTSDIDMVQEERNSDNVQSTKMLDMKIPEKSSKSKSTHLVHPSMRLKKQKQTSKSASNTLSTTSETKRNKPTHPSMRLKPTVASQKSPVTFDTNSSSSAGITSPKTKVKSPTPAIITSSKPTEITSPKQSAETTSQKSSSELKPVAGGKPASYGMTGGKPLSYSKSLAENDMGRKPTGGKPLSYFKSVMEITKVKDSPTPVKKSRGRKPKNENGGGSKTDIPTSAGNQESKTTQKTPNKLQTRKPRQTSEKKPQTKQTKKTPAKKQTTTDPAEKVPLPTPTSVVTSPSTQPLKCSPALKSPPNQTPPKKSPKVPKASVKPKQQIQPADKITDAKKTGKIASGASNLEAMPAKVESPVVMKSIEAPKKSLGNTKEEQTESLSTITQDSPGLGNGKPFQFKGITFDAGKDEDSSDSDSSGSSDSDSNSDDSDEETQNETQDSSSSESDSDTENTGEEEGSTSQTSSPSPNKRQKAGQKRKAIPDNAETIAGLKKRKIVNEEDIKVPLSVGWRRQTRLRPTNTGDGLRGDVYYYSPSGKKLRTYPELNTYIFKNDIKDVKLENFSFSTKLRVGDFLEAKEGSKFEKLTEEQVEERFVNMEERSRASKQRLEQKKEKKREKLEKQKRIQEERKIKKMEQLERKRLKEEERRKAMKDKANEAKMKKEQEKQAAQEAKRMKEEAIMLKKLEKKAAQEANRIAKREKAQNMLAEKQRIKEIKEHERLMKIEQQKMMKEMKQQEIENERERKRQQLVMNKAHEKEKRKRELVMMKAYEAQRRAEERERLKEQKKLEKTLIRQRKLEQKRYERLISKELKKPIDDMALNDLKPLPELPRIENMNIAGKAYADLLMVQEFVCAFGHVLDIEQGDFPGMGELQASLLCESSNEDSLFTACHTLLSYALEDPGVSGKYSTTALGTAIQEVEVNENNISEVLRLFILCRNEGKSHTLSSALLRQPLIALSPINKAAVLAFLCHELLCGKSIGKEIDGSLENMSTLRKDKWNLEGDMRKLKTEIANKKPKETTNSPEKKQADVKKEEDEAKDSDEEKESDNEDGSQDVTSGGGNDTMDEAEIETTEMQNPTTLEQMEKKLKLFDKRHARYRKKLFELSHTVRGIHLGRDRYKRRYFILPNAGGIYVEGLESGHFTEEVCEQTQEEKDEQKEQIDHLLTSLKSPIKTQSSISNDTIKTSTMSPTVMTTVTTITNSVVPTAVVKTEEMKQEGQGTKASSLSVSIPQIKTEINPLLSPRAGLTSPRTGLTSPRGGLTNPTGGLRSPKSKSFNSKWFSVRSKGRCIEEPSCTSQPVQSAPKPIVIPPSCKQLGDDHRFLESVYACYTNNSGGSSLPYSCGLLPLSQNRLSGPSLLGLPPEIDINRLIQHDPQKAAELLELQSVVPQTIPDEYCSGWWRITDPEMMQRLNKCAHQRAVRERQLQKSVARLQEYANTSCKVNNSSFSLTLPDEDVEVKDNEKLGTETDDKWFPQLAYASDKAALIEVEELEEKVFSASLQVKGWRLSQKISPTLHIDVSETYNPTDEENPLIMASTRLLALESGIERRYMKPPFKIDKGNKPETNESKEDLKNSNIQSVTPQLLQWRTAVEEATSAAQISMCVTVLFESIAWEKSIMKVFCILCRKSDNEERLLLCDACDRGCHTYCCKPKLETIPDGDWFCQECVLMASGSDQCYSCKGKSGKRLKCGFCPRHYHMHCLEPPLHKTPRSPWSCPVCKKARSRTKPPPRKKPRVEQLAKKEELARGKMSSSRSQTSKDMEPCRVMLSEMENHESAWPFLVPVNMKQFPEYYKIIKHPMDFHTMKIKLRDYQYKSRDEFARDAKLVFFNCKTFNEDDSEVGRAGETMQKFFESRWSVVLAGGNKNNTSNSQQHQQRDSKRESSDDENDDNDGDSSSSSEEISSESESSEVEEDSESEAVDTEKGT